MNDPFVSTSTGRETYRISIQPANATSGSFLSATHYFGSRVTEQAKSILPKISDERMAHAIKNLILAIEEAASVYVTVGGDIYALPPVHASTHDDSSVSLDWISPDFRLGFNVESNPDDSSWYLVTSKQLNEIGAYGFLSELDNRELASLLVNFVLANT